MSGRTRARGGLSDMASWGSWDGGEIVERGRALAVVRGWRVYRAADAELLAGCTSRTMAERFAAAVGCEVVLVPPGQPEPATCAEPPEALEGDVAVVAVAPAEPAHALPSKHLPAPSIARELRIVLGDGTPDRHGRILWLRALERTAPAPWYAIGGVHRLADRDE